MDNVVVQSENLNGEPIEPQRLILLEEFIGKQVVVTASVTAVGGGIPLILTSQPRLVGQAQIVANPPMIDGSFLIGEELRATPNVLYPREGATHTYQWRTPVGPIPGATSATYIPDSAANGEWLRV